MKQSNLYTITKIARELSVTRQTIYYWIKKDWIRPKRDYRDYPVFTEEDIRDIKKWFAGLKTPKLTPQKKAQTQNASGWKWQDLQKILWK